MNRTDRLYAVAEDLRAAGAGGRTAESLARRFEVSPRTMKRDLAALQDSGLPIAARPGPHGGYVLAERQSLPPLGLTAAETVAVALALRRSDGLPFAADGRSALTKIVRGLPAAERARVDDLAGRLWVRDGKVPPRSRVARTLDEAVRRRVVTRLRYTDGSGATTRRDVEPAGLAHTRGQWYLLAWCRLRRGPRWFRLDRIDSAHLTNEPAPVHDVSSEFGAPPADATALSV